MVDQNGNILDMTGKKIGTIHEGSGSGDPISIDFGKPISDEQAKELFKGDKSLTVGVHTDGDKSDPVDSTASDVLGGIKDKVADLTGGKSKTEDDMVNDIISGLVANGEDPDVIDGIKKELVNPDENLGVNSVKVDPPVNDKVDKVVNGLSVDGGKVLGSDSKSTLR